MGYEVPNEIYEVVPKMVRTLLSNVKVSDPKGEIVTRGSPYNFAILNNLETSHLGKTLISPNW